MESVVYLNCLYQHYVANNCCYVQQATVINYDCNFDYLLLAVRAIKLLQNTKRTQNSNDDCWQNEKFVAAFVVGAAVVGSTCGSRDKAQHLVVCLPEVSFGDEFEAENCFELNVVSSVHQTVAVAAVDEK